MCIVRSMPNRLLRVPAVLYGTPQLSVHNVLQHPSVQRPQTEETCPKQSPQVRMSTISTASAPGHGYAVHHLVKYPQVAETSKASTYTGRQQLLLICILTQMNCHKLCSPVDTSAMTMDSENLSDFCVFARWDHFYSLRLFMDHFCSFVLTTVLGTYVKTMIAL